MSRREEEDQVRVPITIAPVKSIGGRISAVGSITCTVSKIVINSTQIPLSGGTIELEPGQNMTIKVTYSAAAPGASVWDTWHIGITCRMGNQFGWDPTLHTGKGPIGSTAEIGNLKVPSSPETLSIKWYGKAGGYDEPPPG